MPDNEPIPISRRTFLKGAAFAAGSVLTAAITPAKPIRAETKKILAVPGDIPGDIVLTPENGLVIGGVDTVRAEAVLDEPMSTLIQTAEGVDDEGDTYRKYTVEYRGETFNVKTKIIPSSRYDQLNRYFNTGSNSSIDQEKPITVITYDSEKPDALGLNKVTVYCLQSFAAGENIMPDEDALLPDYYEKEDNLNVLRESWTVLQFAQAFNPTSIQVISDNTTLDSYNNLLKEHGVKPIQNATAVISNWFARGGIAYAIDRPNLPSDSGARFETGARTPIEHYMHHMAASLTHELRHGVEPVVNELGESMYWWIPHISRDAMGESLAKMSEAGFWSDSEEKNMADNLYNIQAPFMPNEGQFNFTAYSPNLAAIILAPYAQEMAHYFQEEFSIYDDQGAITIEALTRVNKYYMKLRDQFLKVIGMDWYWQWQNSKLSDPLYRNQFMALNHLDLFVPLLYAQKVNKGEQIPDNKETFIKDLMETAREEAIRLRTEALQEVFTGQQKILKPFVQTVFDDLMSNYLRGSYDISNFPLIQSPSVGARALFARPRDTAYIQHEGEDFDEKDYRRFHPMYHFAIIEPALDTVQLLVQQSAQTEDYLVGIIYLNEDNKLERVILEKDKPLALPRDKRIIVCFLDKRTDQVVDDVEGSTPEIFTIEAINADQPAPVKNLYLPEIEK